jgi:hypothetical protein
MVPVVRYQPQQVECEVTRWHWRKRKLLERDWRLPFVRTSTCSLQHCSCHFGLGFVHLKKNRCKGFGCGIWSMLEELSASPFRGDLSFGAS